MSLSLNYKIFQSRDHLQRTTDIEISSHTKSQAETLMHQCQKNGPKPDLKRDSSPSQQHRRGHGVERLRDGGPLPSERRPALVPLQRPPGRREQGRQVAERPLGEEGHPPAAHPRRLDRPRRGQVPPAVPEAGPRDEGRRRVRDERLATQALRAQGVLPDHVPAGRGQVPARRQDHPGHRGHGGRALRRGSPRVHPAILLPEGRRRPGREHGVQGQRFHRLALHRRGQSVGGPGRGGPGRGVELHRAGRALEDPQGRRGARQGQ